MISRTKFVIDDEGVAGLFLAAGLGNVKNISPLGAGEYNAVFAADGEDGKAYAIKIAPAPECEILPYEIGMMKAEVYWYGLMKEKTSIGVPEIYYSDFTREVINADWFIMERLVGEHPDKMKLTADEKKELNREIARMTTEIHKVKSDKYGYIQGTLYDTWYDNIRAQAVTMIECSKAKGHASSDGEKLLGYIDEFKDILSNVECCMVNYDIWMPNLIVKRVDGRLKIWWIDPERSFWGDRIADFVCLEMFHQFKDKTQAIADYNVTSDVEVKVCPENEIRYAVMMAYMGLLQETEKYYRYTPFHFGWWRNVISAKLFAYRIGFPILEKYSKK